MEYRINCLLDIGVYVHYVLFSRVTTQTRIFARRRKRSVINFNYVFGVRLLRRTIFQVRNNFPRLFQIRFARAFMTLNICYIFQATTMDISRLLTLLIYPTVLFHLTFNTGMGKEDNSMRTALLSGLQRMTRRGHRGRHISIEAVSINVNRSSGLLMTRLIGIHFFTIFAIRTRASTRHLSSVICFITLRYLIPRNLFRVRGLATGQRSDLRHAIATLLY